MNLGIFFPLGSSLADMAEHGQADRFLSYYLKAYSQNFDQIYLFSYLNESFKLPDNCHLVIPPKNLHRYLYGIILPLIQYKSVRKCDVFRCFHLSATPPAIVSKVFFNKKFVFNYNYDYKKWALIEKKQFLIPFFWILEPLAFFLAKKIFVADESMFQYSFRFVNKLKLILLPNGVDVNLFKPAKKKVNETLILSVGRLETQKNYQLLIKAMSKLTHKIKLQIVGHGSQKMDLVNLAKSLNVKLEIISLVQHTKLPEIYQQATIYVQPSLIEAPVKTLLEAMSCQLPCIATNVPGIQLVITNNQDGILVPNDETALAESINNLLNNMRFSRQLGKNARLKVISKYNLKLLLNNEVKALHSI